MSDMSSISVFESMCTIGLYPESCMDNLPGAGGRQVTQSSQDILD